MMKFSRTGYFSIGFLLLLPCLVFSSELPKPNFNNTGSSDAPKKLALIIAIGRYAEESGWQEISSARDVPLIISTLKSQGFDDENIFVIRDSAATKQGMVDAIKNFTAKIKSGDIVVFHYSGHGQQIEDDNGDEVDGLDECLVPYDAPMTYEEGYKGEKHLRDDLLGVLIEDMRLRAGQKGSVLATIDACYSGSITRGTAKSRGGPRLVSKTFDETKYKSDKGSGMHEEGTKSPGAKTDEAPFVLISASSFDEPDNEATDDSGNGVGPLSLGISKVLSNADTSLTYRRMFEELKTTMATLVPKQTPQIEGDVDFKILGGKAVKQKPYFGIEKIFDDTTVILKAGILYDVYDRSRIEFHPSGTTDPKTSTALAKGRVKSSSELSCEVILDKPVSLELLRSSWAFMTEQGFANINVNVQLNNLPGEVKQTEVEALMKLPTVEIVDRNADLILEGNNQNNGVSIKTARDGAPFGETITGTASAIATETCESIRRYIRGNVFRSVKSSSPDLNIRFELVPVSFSTENGQSHVDTLPLSSKLTEGNQYEFKDGDSFNIKVHNIGRSTGFFSILDIQPDGIINVLAPDSNHAPSEYKIGPDDTWELPGATIGPPFGLEMLKLIATKDWLDFRTIISSHGKPAGTRSALNPVEQLMQESYTGTRGTHLKSLPTGSFSTCDFTFKIIPATGK